VAHQPTAGLQMQLVNPPHEREVSCRHRPGQVIDARPTDGQRRRLLRDRQIVRASIIALRSANLLCRALLPKIVLKLHLCPVQILEASSQQ